MKPARIANRMASNWTSKVLLLALAAIAPACSADPDLVVYVSLDQEFSAPLIAEFEKETGLKVRAEYDTEANKTVGLSRRLIEEKNRPRCDVYWNNEIAQTIRLAELDLLQPYDSPSAADIPKIFRDPANLWTGFAARARVLIVNTELVPDPSQLRSMYDLLKPEWEGKAAIARPLTGTTLTHAVALYQVLGDEAAREYLGTIAKHQSDNPPKVQVTNSNGQTARLVREGTLAWGWTDTDDFAVSLKAGAPVIAIYPDQEPGPNGEAPMGTLLIPNTIAITKGAPRLENAKRFVDWALSREIEERLAFSPSAQIPVREDVPRPDSVRSDFHAMEVDYVELGRQMAARTEELKEMFLAR